MTNQLYWNDVTEGDELPALVKVATTQTLVQWAGASGDFNPLHFEDTFALVLPYAKSDGDLTRAVRIPMQELANKQPDPFKKRCDSSVGRYFLPSGKMSKAPLMEGC
jgi:acyl dehydratase